MLGPPLAGVLILSVGIATSFYINAFATLAVVVALFFMKPAPPSSTKREGVFASIAAGIGFLAHHRILRSVLLMLVAVSLLVRPYSQLMPAYAAHVVHVDARGLGFLLAASGCGAIFGSLLTAIVQERRGLIWFVSVLLMSVGTIVLGTVHVFAIALVVLVFIGLAVLSFAGSSNVALAIAIAGRYARPLDQRFLDDYSRRHSGRLAFARIARDVRRIAGEFDDGRRDRPRYRRYHLDDESRFAPRVRVRLGALDGLRGIAIALVLWFHVWQVTWLRADVPFSGGRINLNAIPEPGFLGVDLFSSSADSACSYHMPMRSCTASRHRRCVTSSIAAHLKSFLRISLRSSRCRCSGSPTSHR